ncbi:hypothetical protein [Pseudomonas sp. WS 5079]|uniref:hypothetical protein n=1 Tax=Pseudomonas sp. WS 5079 TaxID=2717492 RepID=UPI00155738E0|nr:hypothetical protein [Pseudomonas sp. WS 5079]NMX60966.1 hypothetical protein [Pseudomonas sp. WS 5079]
MGGLISGMMGAASAALPGIGQLVGAMAETAAKMLKGGSGENEEKDSGKVAEDVHVKTNMSITY